MRVSDLMSRQPRYCSIRQWASDAARAMRDFDVGCIPVVDDDGLTVGMVTDRDICLQAYVRDLPLKELPLTQVMSHALHSCSPSETLTSAERTMRDWHVRRLPVVDDAGKLVGVLSLDDIITAGASSFLARTRQRLLGDIQATYAAVCRRRVSTRQRSYVALRAHRAGPKVPRY